MATVPPLSTAAAPPRERHVLVAFSGLWLAMLLAALDGTIVAQSRSGNS